MQHGTTANGFPAASDRSTIGSVACMCICAFVHLCICRRQQHQTNEPSNKTTKQHIVRIGIGIGVGNANTIVGQAYLIRVQTHDDRTVAPEFGVFL